MSETSEAPSNRLPVNQAALAWLQEAKASPSVGVSYLAQLASWGLEKDLVDVPRPSSASQPERYSLEMQVGALLGVGEAAVAAATRWLLGNPNLSVDEQATNLSGLLAQAETPQEAAQAAVETVYDRMVAASATIQE